MWKDKFKNIQQIAQEVQEFCLQQSKKSELCFASCGAFGGDCELTNCTSIGLYRFIPEQGKTEQVNTQEVYRCFVSGRVGRMDERIEIPYNWVLNWISPTPLQEKVILIKKYCEQIHRQNTTCKECELLREGYCFCSSKESQLKSPTFPKNWSITLKGEN